MQMRHMRSFSALDARGNAHQIHVFTQFIQVGRNGNSREIEGETFLRTDNGDRVDEICPGVYDLPHFCGPIRVKTSVLRSAI